ncbi:FAD-dependent oxidoreductase [Acinetobacter sp. B5B]|uniref:FAD-dependent oxidoreductase n=1 Tax=Acinetobacter baretiae TaxID=2605383 RepID=UPI0018C2B3BE|nr:FAD-dependent oxidoreductase [Acinetobacter baretiae]MBF7682246.1 FAD-dependent oxidoreductase [Acinetobacter baretiae]MBF7685074.1 FAD-dependent oxidoreductase [Acinetobacter baretiae]
MKWSILGDGVTGLCVATALTQAGECCEVITSNHTAASHWAGGMLAPYCEAESASAYVTEQGLKAITWWQNHIQTVHRQGTLVVAPVRDTQELHHFAHLTQGHQWVKPHTLEPDLADSFEKGLFFSQEAHLNPRHALQQLKEQLKQRGVMFHHQAPSGKIVDCRGISATDTLSNLRAVRGEMLILHSNDLEFSRPIRFLHPRFPCYLVPRGDGQFMLGATMVESQDTGQITVRALLELLTSLYVLNPAFAEAKILETGTGLRPSFPNNLPQIQYQQGKHFINGMYRHGFLLAPILAEQFVQSISKS